MTVSAQPRIVVIYNRDFEGAESDPENRAREDVENVATHLMRVLEGRGHVAHAVGIRDDMAATMDEIRRCDPAVVFNLCESVGGDSRFEPLLPLLLEQSQLAYTGSGPLALSLALHKHKAKEVLRARGVPTPEAAFVTHKAQSVALPYPLIVKPAREDASVGIYSESVVWNEAALQTRVAHVLDQYQQPALVERYIEGREIYVSLLGRLDGPPEVLPFFEIDFSGLPSDRPRIVSFEGKWVEDSVEYAGTKPVRCELEPAVASRVADAALGAWDALELRDYGRVDIRLASDGTPYVIDINPNCDLSHEAGGFARAARAAGLAYDGLVARLLDLALARQSHAPRSRTTSRTASREARATPSASSAVPPTAAVFAASGRRPRALDS